MGMEGESVRKIIINHRARVLGHIWHEFCCVLKRINLLPFKNVGTALPTVTLFPGSPPSGLHGVRRAPGWWLWWRVCLLNVCFSYILTCPRLTSVRKDVTVHCQCLLKVGRFRCMYTLNATQGRKGGKEGREGGREEESCKLKTSAFHTLLWVWITWGFSFHADFDSVGLRPAGLPSEQGPKRCLCCWSRDHVETLNYMRLSFCSIMSIILQETGVLTS